MDLLLLPLHIAGGTGGVFVKRLRLPAGALVGAMLASLLYNSAIGRTVDYPMNLRVVMQVLSGLVIGHRFTRSDVRALKTMFVPAVVLVVSMLTINWIFGYIIASFSELDLVTALFVAAPGGVSDLALIAIDFGATMEHVALLQLFRFVFVVLAFPPLLKWILRIPTPTEVTYSEGGNGNGGNRNIDFLLTLTSAAVGGVGFYLLKIPAGAILGAIIGTVVFNLVTERAYYPPWAKTTAQAGAGTYIGSKITIQVMIASKVLFVPALLLIVELIVMALVTGFFLRTICKMSWPTALFSATPAGIQEIGLISNEMGLETPKIVLLHTVRVMSVLGFLPFLVQLVM